MSPHASASQPTVLHCVMAVHMQVIGREREVARVIQILGRRTKNNPILLGEPGAQQLLAVSVYVVHWCELEDTADQYSAISVVCALGR